MSRNSLVHPRKLSFEQLEDRRVLAMLTVNSIADTALNDGDAVLSLREAISVVNQGNTTGLESPAELAQVSGAPLGTNDTIQFDPAVFASSQTILLVLGQLPIEVDLIINGPLAELTIDAQDVSRVFFVQSAEDVRRNVTFNDLVLTNGAAVGDFGGGIYNEENLTLDNVTVSSSSAGEGGGIAHRLVDALARPSLVVRNGSRILDNVAEFNGGGIHATADTILHVLSGSEISENMSEPGSGGGIYSEAYELEIQDAIISGNTAVVQGGGIYMTTGDESGLPGSANIERTVVSNNFIASNGEGGGIYSLNLAGEVTVSDSTIESNFVGVYIDTFSPPGYFAGRGDGGGIYAYVATIGDALTTIENCLVWDNEALEAGGGIYARAEGLDADSARIHIINTTVSENRANGGGGIAVFSAFADGSGYANADGFVLVQHCTITKNVAGIHPPDKPGPIQGGGGLSLHAISGMDSGVGNGWDDQDLSNDYFAALISHTIIADNVVNCDAANDCRDPLPGYSFRQFESPDVGLITTSISGIYPSAPYLNRPVDSPPVYLRADYSLIGNADGPIEYGDDQPRYNIAIDGVGNRSGSPGLGPLADNGGPTLTHHPLPGSQVIDAGDPSLVAGAGDTPQYDQRGPGFTRVYTPTPPVPQRIDIGAVEVQPEAQPPCPAGDYNRNGTVDAADYALWRGTLGEMVAAPYDGADGDGDLTVDQDDYLVWQANFGRVCAGTAAHATRDTQLSYTFSLRDTRSVADGIEKPLHGGADSIAHRAPLSPSVHAKAFAQLGDTPSRPWDSAPTRSAKSSIPAESRAGSLALMSMIERRGAELTAELRKVERGSDRDQADDTTSARWRERQVSRDLQSAIDEYFGTI